jgi:hypothetical protein
VVVSGHLAVGWMTGRIELATLTGKPAKQDVA